MAITRILLLIAIVVLPMRAWGAGCELRMVISEGSTSKVTWGPFTTEDGVTPVVPTTVTYSIYRTAGAEVVADQLLAPVTLTNPADFTTDTFSVVIPASANVVIKSSPNTPEKHTLTIKWTWVSGQGTKQCVFPVQQLPFLP